MPPRPLLLPLLCLLLLCGGCTTSPYLPPSRPVAGMFPTVVPPLCLQEAVPVPLSPGEVREHLEAENLWAPLLQAGFPQGELALLSRSLTRRGYAEIDARRCPRPGLLWVALLATAPHRLSLQYQVDGAPPRRVLHPLPLPRQK